MSDPLAIRGLTHSASGASVRVHPYGATLLSYNNNNNKRSQPPDPQRQQQDYPPPRGRRREHLFVSDTAILDGSAPIRGGIPLVFPIFGPPPAGSTMPQHGFARRNVWTLVREYDEPASAGLVWELSYSHNQVTRASCGEGNAWAYVSDDDNDEFQKDDTRGGGGGGGPYRCSLRLTVDFHESRLTTALTIANTGTVAFPFQALLHTYYKIHGHAALDPAQCYVRGLEGYTVTDKVSPNTTDPDVLVDGAKITIASEVDRVYTPPLDGSSGNRDTGGVHVMMGVGDQQTVAMSSTAQVGGVAVPVSCVVWNPYRDKAAAMADFSDEHYHDMLCVEPGIGLSDSDRTVLHPGLHAVLTQVLRV